MCSRVCLCLCMSSASVYVCIHVVGLHPLFGQGLRVSSRKGAVDRRIVTIGGLV